MCALEKSEIRKQMLHLRSQLKEKFIENSEKRIGGQLVSLPLFQKAETVMLYCSYKNEAGTFRLLDYCFQTKKQVVLPLTDENYLIHPYLVTQMDYVKPDPRGILEPDPQQCEKIDPALIDLIIIPGVAFDITGGRIGFGKGCYDRFLPQLRSDVPLIGFAYDFQVLPHIPQEPTDRKMDLIITEKGLLQLPGSHLDLSQS